MRLTHLARQRIKEYPKDDLIILLHDILDCLSERSRLHPQHRMEAMAAVIHSLTGIDLTSHTARTGAAVRARSVFCFVARREGFTAQAIGEFIGRHHSSVYYAENHMAEALTMPTAYEDYIELYNRFIERLK